jgi:hypothetical protein
VLHPLHPLHLVGLDLLLLNLLLLLLSLLLLLLFLLLLGLLLSLLLLLLLLPARALLGGGESRRGAQGQERRQGLVAHSLASRVGGKNPGPPSFVRAGRMPIP